MWHLYILLSLLTAGVVIKMVHPLMGRGQHRHSDAITKADHILVYLIVVAVPVFSVLFYLLLGNPDLPGRPAMIEKPGDVALRQQSLLAQKPIETLLTKNPNDLQSILALGILSKRIGNHEEAVRFYKRAVELSKEDMLHRVIVVALGEMQVDAAGGVVDDAATKTFEYALTLHPQNPIARYYLALAKDQAGNKQGAVDAWQKLFEEGHPNAYWKKKVRRDMARARAEMRAAGK